MVHNNTHCQLEKFQCIFYIMKQAEFKLIDVNIHLGPQDVCNREVYNVTCGAGEVIVMVSARYGRMQIRRCVKRNLGGYNLVANF